jgi:hypothetical protein
VRTAGAVVILLTSGYTQRMVNVLQDVQTTQQDSDGGDDGGDDDTGDDVDVI